MTDNNDQWGVQASLKFGPNGQNLLNVRGPNAALLAAECEALTEHLQTDDWLSSLASALGSASPSPAATITNAFPGAQQQAGPSCQHGPMKDLSAKNYRHRWYCSAPKGQPQCQAQD